MAMFYQREIINEKIIIKKIGISRVEKYSN